MKTELKEFWQQTFQALDKIPMDPKTVSNKNDYYLTLKEVVLRSWENIRFQSMLVIPKVMPKPLDKAIIYVGGSYQGYKPRPQFWFEDAATFLVDPRGQGHSLMDINTPDHFIHGIRRKETYRYRGVYCDFRRAIDYLESQGYKRICFAGTCFGGGVAVAMAALDKRISCAAADTPWPCNIIWAVEHKIKGYAQIWELLERNPNLKDEVYESLQYFDPIYLADECKVPTLLAINRTDPTIHQFTAKSLYEQLGGTRCLVEFEGIQHGCSAPVTAIIRDWIRLWL